jgi:prolipoprotein diacylglyceryltransferase
MRPVLFEWRRVRIPSYLAMLYLGLVVGVGAGNLAAHAAHLDGFKVFAATFLLLIPALAGARLLHVACNWSFYRAHPDRIWDRAGGGADMYGGVPAMLILSVPVLALMGLPLGTFWDVASFSILTGMVVTRIGCLLHGCCAGRLYEGWPAMRLPGPDGRLARRLPTPLFEAGLAAVVLMTAALAWPATPFPGALFLLVVAGYASGRLLLESTRQESVGSRFTISHAISAALVALALGTLAAVAALAGRPA